MEGRGTTQALLQLQVHRPLATAGGACEVVHHEDREAGREHLCIEEGAQVESRGIGQCGHEAL